MSSPNLQFCELAPQSAPHLWQAPSMQEPNGHRITPARRVLNIVRSIKRYLFPADVAECDEVTSLSAEAESASWNPSDCHRSIEVVMTVVGVMPAPIGVSDAEINLMLKDSCATMCGAFPRIPIRFAAPVTTAWGVRVKPQTVEAAK